MASTVLIDQVRAVDARRVKGYLGTLEETVFQPILYSLLLMGVYIILLNDSGLLLGELSAWPHPRAKSYCRDIHS